jgi:hypothetical protein
MRIECPIRARRPPPAEGEEDDAAASVEAGGMGEAEGLVLPFFVGAFPSSSSVGSMNFGGNPCASTRIDPGRTPSRTAARRRRVFITVPVESWLVATAA